MRPWPKPEFTCSVAVRALAEQTSIEAGLYAFAYTVTIVNSGDVTAQLIGAIGSSPTSAATPSRCAGWAWSGTSRCSSPASASNTPAGRASPRRAGTMRGTYFCMTEEAMPFDAPVPEFRLGGAPATLH